MKRGFPWKSNKTFRDLPLGTKGFKNSRKLKMIDYLKYIHQMMVVLLKYIAKFSSENILFVFKSWRHGPLIPQEHIYGCDYRIICSLCRNYNVTRHEKIGLMCTKYTASHYCTYLTFCECYTNSVNCLE